MIKPLRTFRSLFLSNAFRKNVTTMFSGTLISQGIYLLFYPVLTRIYTASDFGQFAIFSAFLSILSILATGQYELALLLPKKKSSLKALLNGSVLLSILISTTVTICLFLGMPLLKRYDFFDSPFQVFFLGISVLINSLYQIGFYIAVRNKHFQRLAQVNILNVGLGLLFQILLSFFFLKEFGLAIGYMIGTSAAMVILFRQYYSPQDLLDGHSVSLDKIKDQLKRYRQFPLLNLPASFVNLLANQIPQLMLNTFGQSTVGYFALSQKVLGSPITLFSTSVSHVFKEKASFDYRNTKNCRPIFLKTFRTLFLISIIPFLLIVILSPSLVPIVLGQDWAIAGKYIQALALMYFFKFTVSPLTYVIIIAEKQHLNLILQTFLLLLSALSVYLGIQHNDPYISVVSYSISYSLIYIVFLLISYKVSKHDD